MALFDGKTAIVTGAAQGIGNAVATRLYAEGANVVMADMQQQKVTDATARLDPEGGRVLAQEVNVSDTASVEAMVDAAMTRFGQLDVLVNVAGGSGNVIIEQIEDMTDEIWDRVLGSNLRGTFLCSRAAVPHLKAGGGAIVNFATGSIRGFPKKTTAAARLAYVSAKAGIIGFTNQLSRDLEPFSVAVNAIQPGFVLTEPGARVREIFDSLPEEEKKAMLARRTPRTPEELGWATTFVASRDAKTLTGTSIRLTGPIESLDLKVVHDPEGQLATTASLQAQ